MPCPKRNIYQMQVVKASLTWSNKGKAEFHPTNQTWVDINESSATLEYILSCVRDKWGEDYVLVTLDGIEIEEASGILYIRTQQRM